MQPLGNAIDVGQFGTALVHQETIRKNLARGLPELTPALCAHDGTCVLVASGPSIHQFVDEIRAEREKGRPIVAIKGAHDFLCEHGIEPDLFISVEPRDRRNNLSHKTERTIYLLASRVAPEVFDHLGKERVIVWHSLSFDEERDVFKDTGKMLIAGGTTSGLRAINVMYYLGFRNFVLYGYDSCLAEDGKTKRFDGSQAGQMIPVIMGGRKFTCNFAMAAQANEFQNVWRVMPDVHIESKGDGLISWIISERKKHGKKT